jgi:hypothetical protein
VISASIMLSQRRSTFPAAFFAAFSGQASEPAVSVFSVADEFDLDYPLGLEDRIDNTVIPLNSDAVTTPSTLEFLALLWKGIKREIVDYTESPPSNVLWKPGDVVFDRAAIPNLPRHSRICGTAFL